MEPGTPPREDDATEAFPRQQSNLLGKIGFVLSFLGALNLGVGAALGLFKQPLVGIVAVIPALVGTLLSAAAVQRPPRVFATVGLILGLGASVFFGAVFVVVVINPPAAGPSPLVAHHSTPDAFRAASGPADAVPDTQPTGPVLAVHLSGSGEPAVEGRPCSEAELRSRLATAAVAYPRPYVELSYSDITPDDKIIRVAQTCAQLGLVLRLGKVTKEGPEKEDRDAFVRHLLGLPDQPATQRSQP
jgi:hypothetical protein